MQFHGIVEKGQGKGDVFGYPTANILLGDASVSGIYAGAVMVDGEEYNAAVYADPKRGLLESHLLDFSGDLYGKEITVTLGQKIRDDKEFTDEKQLLAQIEEDVATIRALPRTI